MVDWLENDRSQSIRRDDAKRYVDASAPLAFCRDVCNGSKHAQLEEKGVDLDHGLSMVGSSVVVGADGQPFTREFIVAKLVVWWQDRWVPVLEFADGCISAWDDLLLRYGLVDISGTQTGT